VATWLDALPEISKHRDACDAAVLTFQERIAALVGASAGESRETLDQAYNGAVTAWSSLLNIVDRFAGLGCALARDYPDQVKFLIGGSILELTDNLLASASVLREVGGDRPDPLALVSDQPQAFSFAKELISICFPGEVAGYRSKFERLGLPISGFPANVGDVHLADTDVGIRILHISDIHRTKDEPVTNLEVLEHLRRSVQEIDEGRIDLIIVSGDLTQSAKANEYAEAKQLLSAFVD